MCFKYAETFSIHLILLTESKGCEVGVTELNGTAFKGVCEREGERETSENE